MPPRNLPTCNLKTWRSRRSSFLAVLLSLLIASFPLPGMAQQESCVTCHQALEGRLSAPVKGMEADVHAKRGLGCSGCHGGDPKRIGMDAMDPRAGYLGAPKPADVPAFCGRCHSDPAFMRRYNPRMPTDQLAEFKTSVHGQRLARGDTKVATCTSCHGVHPVRAVTDPRSPVYATNIPETCGRCHADPAYMKGYGIPTDQLSKYRRSVHGEALLQRGNRLAPACNGCHGNHGAVPPGVESIANVCAQCHSATRDLFVKSPHKVAFDSMGLPECSTCHGNHEVAHPTDEMLGAGPQAFCTRCHEPGSKGLAAAQAMRASLEALKSRLEEAQALVSQAANAGVEMSEARLTLQEAQTRLIQARNVIHSFSPKQVEAVITEGLKFAEKGVAAGKAGLAEVRFRRRGLSIALVILVGTAILLFLKVREMERQRMGPHP